MLAFASTQVVGAGDKGDEARANIETMIKNITAEHSTPIRARLAEQLSTFIQHSDRAAIDALDAKEIDDLAGLLSDRDDVVRFWAALALGHIGAPAARAIPVLERALREAEPALGSNIIGPDLSSASAIRGALRKISGR
jgi:HEAT repeat protein